MINWITTRLALFTTSVIFALVLTSSTPAQKAGPRKTLPRGKASQKAVQYVCPMHPEVTSTSRHSRCPKCGMALVAAKADNTATAVQGIAVETATRGAEVASSRLHIPDTVVYDQNGRRLNFYTDLVRGKTVAINFIFTTCKTVCPPLTATFRKVQQDLGARVGRDVALVSISVDPTTDVPERLKEFASKFKAGPGWTFVTGSKPEIDQLLRALGASIPDKNNHSSMILVGNERAGYWTRTNGVASAATIVEAVNEASSKNVSASDVSDAAMEVPLPGIKAGAEAGERQVMRTASASSSSTSGDQSKAEFHKALANAAASYFPNTVLLTQDNKEVHFYEDLLKGKIALINFAFTACQGSCSPMTANLARVQKYLGDRVGRDVVMISISVDPNTDTPNVLKKYAASFHAQPGWYFLTGKKENVDQVLHKLGGYVAERNEHSLVLLIGNEATGEWIKMHAMANPSEIASAVNKLLAKEAKASTK